MGIGDDQFPFLVFVSRRFFCETKKTIQESITAIAKFEEVEVAGKFVGEEEVVDVGIEL